MQKAARRPYDRDEKRTKGPVAPLPTSPKGEETLSLPPWGSAPSPTGEGWGEASPFHFWPFTRRMFKGLLLRSPNDMVIYDLTILNNLRFDDLLFTIYVLFSNLAIYFLPQTPYPPLGGTTPSLTGEGWGEAYSSLRQRRWGEAFPLRGFLGASFPKFACKGTK